MRIEDIKDPKFLKNLSYKELNELSSDIRKFILETVSEHGGHLSSNLGVVELTIALHRVFDMPNDKILFDVGHQTYTHKILTGRAKEFKESFSTIFSGKYEVVLDENEKDLIIEKVTTNKPEDSNENTESSGSSSEQTVQSNDVE